MNIHLYPTPLTMESRIARITGILADHKIFNRIVTVGTQVDDLPDSQTLDSVRSIVRVPRRWESSNNLLGKVIKTTSWSSRVSHKLADWKIDCINCHSLPLLPLCVRLKKRHGAKLIYDPHELETESVTSRGIRRLMLRRIERKLIHEADACVFVSHAIAQWYREKYQLSNTTVFRNIPRGQAATAPAKSRILRDKFRISDEHIVFIYQGGLYRHRRIEDLLDIFATTPLDRHIIFMGFGELEDLVRQYAARHPNIHFHPAVPQQEVLNYTQGADIGICATENLCQSHYYSLPNKFFEYMFAGIGVIIPDLPEMSSIVRQYGNGFVVTEDSHAGWVSAIARITRQKISLTKEASVRTCPDFSSEKEVATLVAAYRQIIKPTPA